MATAPALMTIEQYLRTSYSPDVDFVEGEIEERNLGERDHARLISLLSAIFVAREGEYGIESFSDYRMLVKENRVRVCDFLVTDAAAPYEEVLRTPPLLCIEIMSPEDRLARTTKVLQDYFEMGVPNIWLIDPQRRLAYTFGAGGLHQQNDLQLMGSRSGIHLDVYSLLKRLERSSERSS